jgi:hypothetical protein
LAFSFKPRVGFDLRGLQQTALDVLSAGFNIVELDARHLPLDVTMLNKLIELSSIIPDKLRHVGRLSLNLSMQPDLVIEAADRLCQSTPCPTIFKIDGGFNGFGLVQSTRGRGLRDGRKCGPIITCYPLMQHAVPRYIPADQYIMRLAASRGGHHLPRRAPRCRSHEAIIGRSRPKQYRRSGGPISETGGERMADAFNCWGNLLGNCERSTNCLVLMLRGF